MEINLKKLSDREIESTTGSKKMRLSENAQSMVFQMFTKNVYSNPIGTIVREITSNCFDSHIEANVDSPVLIKHWLDNNTDTHYISFYDYGVGMSPDRIENVYSVYFESTKRMDNTQIGGFGIGGKTPLAYRRNTGLGEDEYDNSFYVITTFDKKKYYYMIYEGEETPIVSLLHEEDTKDHNGTEVRIPVLEKDLQKFGNEITKQLYYFENLVFEGFEDIDDTITNEYKIVKAKSFLFRGDDLGNNIHICLGRVAYPLDYSAIGLSTYDYRLPFAIKFDVGEINPTVSRESIDYSEKTIELIKTKLKEIILEMTDIVKSKYDNIKTLEEYFSVKDKYGYYNFDGIKTSVNVRELIDFSKLDLTNFKFNFMKMPNFNQLFELFFKLKTYGDKRSYNGNYSSGYDIIGNTNVFYCPNGFNRKVIKQGYLANEYTKFHVVTKVNDFFEDNVNTVCSIFNVSETVLFDYVKQLDSEGNETKTTLTISGLTDFAKSIVDLQNEMSLILEKHLTNYDDVVVSDEFILKRKERKEKLNFDGVSFTVHSFNNHYDTRNRIEFTTLGKFNGSIYYSIRDDDYKFKAYVSIFKQLFPTVTVQSVGYGGSIREAHNYSSFGNINKDKNSKAKILFLEVAKTNLKYMKGLENANPIEDIVQDLLRRKFDQLENFLTFEKIFNLYDSLSRFYKHQNLQLIDGLTYKKMVLIKKRINEFKLKAGTNEFDFRNFDHYETFKQIANIEKIKVNEDVVKLEKRINDMLAIDAKNSPTLRYIDISADDIKDHNTEIKVDILKKLMVFK